MRAYARLRTADGALLTDQVLWTVSQASELPPPDQMLKRVERMRDDLLSLAETAKPMEDEYVGPVIFEGSAARDLMRYLLTPQLEGTPCGGPLRQLLRRPGGQQTGRSRRPSRAAGALDGRGRPDLAAPPGAARA